MGLRRRPQVDQTGVGALEKMEINFPILPLALRTAGQEPVLEDSVAVD